MIMQTLQINIKLIIKNLKKVTFIMLIQKKEKLNNNNKRL